MFDECDVISVYTREQAIDDGVLVDVSEMAKEAGFKFPVAMTIASYEDCVAWDEADNIRKNWIQDVPGRLWDVLYMAMFAIKTATSGGQVLNYELYRVPRHGKGVKPRRTQLKLVCGPGDNAEPVITIMLPDED